MKARSLIKNEDVINNEENDENNDSINNEDYTDEYLDSRLLHVLTVLDLSFLYEVFISNCISFVDMLLLEKEDMIELQLELFQRNRIWNFSYLYKKYAKSYSIEEIDDFFLFNRQFIFMKQTSSKAHSMNDSRMMNSIKNPLNQTNDCYKNSKQQIKTLDDDDDDEDKQVQVQENNGEDYEGEGNHYINPNDNHCNIVQDIKPIVYQQYSRSKNQSHRTNDKMNQSTKTKAQTKSISNTKESLPAKEITLSTSKQNVHDEIEENKAYPNAYTCQCETCPNIHQSSLENYDDSNKLITEGNQYYVNTIYKRGSNNNIGFSPIEGRQSCSNLPYNAYKNFNVLKQDADDILERLSKQKEESELKKNKYRVLLQKVAYSSSSSNNTTNAKQKIMSNDVHYKRMMRRIEEASEMKMGFKAFEQLNQIKEFINIKGNQIKFADIQLVNRELNILINSLKDDLNECNDGDNEVEREEGNNQEDNVEEVEEVEEEYDEDGN